MASKKKLDEAGAAVFDKFFSSQDAENGSQKGDSKSDDSLSGKGRKKANKRVFSFRGDDSAVTEWRVYADASGMKVDELGTAAMKEYIENHPLNPDQKKIYDLKMKQRGE